MVLHPTLDDILDDCIYCELARVRHQAAELEAAMKLHQAQMKQVCYCIQHYASWLHFPVLSFVCPLCKDLIFPEFMRRHRSRCPKLALTGRRLRGN